MHPLRVFHGNSRCQARWLPDLRTATPTQAGVQPGCAGMHLLFFDEAVAAVVASTGCYPASLRHLSNTANPLLLSDDLFIGCPSSCKLVRTS